MIAIDISLLLHIFPIYVSFITLCGFFDTMYQDIIEYDQEEKADIEYFLNELSEFSREERIIEENYIVEKNKLNILVKESISTFDTPLRWNLFYEKNSKIVLDKKKIKREEIYLQKKLYIIIQNI